MSLLVSRGCLCGTDHDGTANSSPPGLRPRRAGGIGADEVHAMDRASNVDLAAQIKSIMIR
ncbi:hypothetical protein, partial [Actinomadura coerulea]|uniref:hypothetical protein n=1 Tax=Actinomadura coerulea TaxID=46159 RepID=UPI00341AA501